MKQPNNDNKGGKKETVCYQYRIVTLYKKKKKNPEFLRRKLQKSTYNLKILKVRKNKFKKIQNPAL